MRVATFILIGLSAVSFGSQALASDEVKSAPLVTPVAPVVTAGMSALNIREGREGNTGLESKVVDASLPRHVTAYVPPAREFELPHNRMLPARDANSYDAFDAGVRHPPARPFTDHVLTGVVALMLIAYQLRRKHRVLRPRPFSL